MESLQRFTLNIKDPKMALLYNKSNSARVFKTAVVLTSLRFFLVLYSFVSIAVRGTSAYPKALLLE